jgi:hypothetical protein
LVPAALLASATAMVVRFAGSSGAERLQLKWFVTAAVLVVAAVIPLSLTPQIGLSPAVGSAVISRTLAYAIVTSVLAGVYAGLVLLATQVFRVQAPVAVAAATLAAAALFSPVRHRVQRRVDRRFNRSRYDADQNLAAFAVRLKDAVELDTVREDLTRAVQAALEPAHVSVWTSPRE